MPLVHKGLKELSYDNFEWNTDAYQAFLCGEKADIGGGTIEKAQLHSFMKETLPIFMVPGFIRKLDEMPMTKNGKIDRRKAIESAEVRKK